MKLKSQYTKAIVKMEADEEMKENQNRFQGGIGKKRIMLVLA